MDHLTNSLLFECLAGGRSIFRSHSVEITSLVAFLLFNVEGWGRIVKGLSSVVKYLYSSISCREIF